MSWRCSDAVVSRLRSSRLRKGYATCQGLPLSSCPIHPLPTGGCAALCREGDLTLLRSIGCGNQTGALPATMSALCQCIAEPVSDMTQIRGPEQLMYGKRQKTVLQKQCITRFFPVQVLVVTRPPGRGGDPVFL